MILLAWTLAWSLLTAEGSDVNLILQQDQLLVLYPELHGNGTIACDCRSSQCDSVYWFRIIPATGQVQFLGKLNNANVFSPGNNVNGRHFESRRKTRTSFLLKIINVTEEDAGVYSCVLKERTAKEVWKSGILLLPGVIPPTPPPATTTTKAPVRSACRCSAGGGCGSLVLWPLLGTMAALALTLLSTLYYFSRLPRKCRHRFANPIRTFLIQASREEGQRSAVGGSKPDPRSVLMR